MSKVKIQLAYDVTIFHNGRWVEEAKYGSHRKATKHDDGRITIFSWRLGREVEVDPGLALIKPMEVQ